MSSLVTSIDSELLARLDPEGKLNLSKCLQCGRCSSGCTMRVEADVLPHQLNRMVVYGLEEQLMSCKAIWTCVSCQTCVTRCPMSVDTPALIDKLRTDVSGFRLHHDSGESVDPKSRNTGAAPSEDLERIRIFNDALLGSVRRFGRTYELGLMAAYKLRARDLFSDMKKLPMMLLKGKMSILPPRTPGRNAVARVFDRVRELRRVR
ncbi:MAG: hypothetical protein A2Z18_00825 [Armatimonadetes bacterium RBG_16_58_9]|nr:MAG: hypothetical protein A2Z18_00825 [Armatimonadetes bacterium RBG_16_58_9]